MAEDLSSNLPLLQSIAAATAPTSHGTRNNHDVTSMGVPMAMRNEPMTIGKILVFALLFLMLSAFPAQAEPDAYLLPSGNGVQLTPEERSSFAIRFCRHIRTVSLAQKASAFLVYGEPYRRPADPMGIRDFPDERRMGRPQFLFKLKAPLTAAWSGLTLPAGTVVSFRGEISLTDASENSDSQYFHVGVDENKVTQTPSMAVLLQQPAYADPRWEQIGAQRSDYVDMVARTSAAWFTGGKDKALEDRLVTTARMGHIMCEP